jgi:hypothetical protein
MSYQKTMWVDHIEDPNDIDPATGKPRIVQQGTKVTAARLNNMENGIEQAHALVESVAQNVFGNAVVSGFMFTSSGLSASYTEGIAYVNGVKLDVPAGSITLNPTQGQFLYLDGDGVVKTTINQASAEAKCLLWYMATDATKVITSTDRRTIVNSSTFVKQTDVATSGANKILRLDASGKANISITGDAQTVGGYGITTGSAANKIPVLNSSGKGAFSITGDANSVGGYTLAALDYRYQSKPKVAEIIYVPTGGRIGSDMASYTVHSLNYSLTTSGWYVITVKIEVIGVTYGQKFISIAGAGNDLTFDVMLVRREGGNESYQIGTAVLDPNEVYQVVQCTAIWELPSGTYDLGLYNTNYLYNAKISTYQNGNFVRLATLF